MHKFKLFTGAVFMLLLLTQCHVGRFFYWNFADINDHKKFPARQINKSTAPFHFKQAIAPSLFKIPSAINYKGDDIDFNSFLKKTETLGFLIIKNDSIVYEYYAPQKDDQMIVPSFSVAKSVVSILLGIAIDEGYVKSVKEPITNYLTDLDREKFGKITIEDVLNMRSGIDFNESYFNPLGDVAKYYYGTNLKKYIAKQGIKKEPDSAFQYISLNTQLLGFIVERATGKKLDEYLQQKLWQPMGMEYDASWSIDSKRNGNIKAFCCLNARMRDFAKFGRLYLNKGNWNGQQLVSTTWVEQSIKPEPKNNFIYSYQWWHTRTYTNQADTLSNGFMYKPINYNKKADDRKPLNEAIYPNMDFYAEGILGQYVYVFPEKNIIIVRLGKNYNFQSWPRLFHAIAKAN